MNIIKRDPDTGVTLYDDESGPFPYHVMGYDGVMRPYNKLRIAVQVYDAEIGHAQYLKETTTT